MTAPKDEDTLLAIADRDVRYRQRPLKKGQLGTGSNADRAARDRGLLLVELAALKRHADTYERLSEYWEKRWRTVVESHNPLLDTAEEALATERELRIHIAAAERRAHDAERLMLTIADSPELKYLSAIQVIDAVLTQLGAKGDTIVERITMLAAGQVVIKNLEAHATWLETRGTARAVEEAQILRAHLREAADGTIKGATKEVS